MSKKLYGLISGLLGVAVTTSEILLAFFQPHMYGAIMAAVGIAAKATDEIMLLFVNDSVEKKSKTNK